DVMQKLGILIDFKEDEMKDANTLTNKLYKQAKQAYNDKMEGLSNTVMPQFQQIFQEQGDRIHNIVVPFTDGVKGLQIYVDLKEAINTNGKNLKSTLERNITLAMIDDTWKEHLRGMDDLRQSVQMASYEQKDPLLIYKFEAFQLFKKTLL